MKKFVKFLSFALLCVLAFTLVACAPKDAAAAKEKLEKKDYVVVAADLEKDNSEKVAATVSGTKNLLTKNSHTVIATKYWKAADAKDAYKDAKENAKDGVKVAKSGKWVIVGDKESVKDFK